MEDSRKTTWEYRNGAYVLEYDPARTTEKKAIRGERWKMFFFWTGFFFAGATIVVFLASRVIPRI
ncbi:MAG: hypothetical protein HRU80_01355 [Ignavibacteriales bacterium]|nr:hypothetical protein [Ignavibacteriaceae bacterium]MCK6614801.1 hypothetical protein [Ignavibacteriaceae bacterium]QOJ27581.1 MAG: hypothetical protein HRU80_01355 [Ignavibacteriales bacterium]